jgi:hypothetical protein
VSNNTFGGYGTVGGQPGIVQPTYQTPPPIGGGYPMQTAWATLGGSPGGSSGSSGGPVTSPTTSHTWFWIFVIVLLAIIILAAIVVVFVMSDD